MKKIVPLLIVCFALIVPNANAWDIGTYPESMEMKSNVFHYFMDYALTVDTSETSTDTAERIKYAMDIVAGRANRAIMSVAVATNASIRAKIIASNDTYVNDLEYVIATEYESGSGIPLFTILAEKIYGTRPE
jgi:hypothetical protein